MFEYLIPILFFDIVDILKIFLFLDIYKFTLVNVQNSDLDINLYGAILSYLVLNIFIFYLIYFDKSVQESVFLIFVIFSIYNFTNYATFKNYNSFAYIFIDISSAMLTVMLTIYLSQYLKKFEN